MDLVWTTGARVKRSSFFDGDFYEELAVDNKSIRLERLNSGAPLLDNHGTGFWGGLKGLRDVIGVVEKAKIENNRGIATVRFSTRADVQDIIKDIQEGIIRNVSVGYRVHRFEELEDKDDGLPIYRAVDWEPMELSMVGIPADAGAQSRSGQPMQVIDATLTEREENMGKKRSEKPSGSDVSDTPEAEVKPEGAETPQAAAQPSGEAEPPKEGSETPVSPSAEAPAPAPETPKEGSEAPSGEAPAASESGERAATTGADEVRAQEIKRQDEIRKAVRLASLGEEFADGLCRDSKISVEDARAAIFKELEKRTSSLTRNQRVEVKDMEQKQLRREAAVRAMLHRFDPAKYTIKDDEREFRQGSLVDMARHFLALEGVRDAHSMSRAELAKRALHHSSDFPEVLANTANKSLRDAYMGAPNTYSPFVAQKNVSDFKQISSVQLSNGGKLEKVNEHGEYKKTTIAESAEKYKVEKYGIIVGRTYELIVNDDLDAFTRIPNQLGVRAREKENEIFWGLILSNQVMAEDGLALYHATHNNLTSPGTAIAVASLSVLRSRLRLQKDLDGELMNLGLDWIVVPAALETVAEQFISQQIIAEQAGNTNPFYNKLKLIVEPRLDANSAIAWYGMADKSKVAIGEMALLDGKAPEMFVREGFEVDGAELKVRYEFGMRIVDYRGAQKNLGA